MLWKLVVSPFSGGGGTYSERDIFNFEAVMVYDPRHPNLLIDQLIKFSENLEFRKDFSQRIVFQPGAAARIFMRYFYPVLKHIQLITGQDLFLFRKCPSSYTTLAREAQQAREILAIIGTTEETYSYLTEKAYRWPFLARERQALQQFKQ